MKIQQKQLREKAHKFLIQEATHKSVSVLNPKFEAFKGPLNNRGSVDMNPVNNMIESKFSFIDFNHKSNAKKNIPQEKIFQNPSDRAEEIYKIIKDMNTSIRV